MPEGTILGGVVVLAASMAGRVLIALSMLTTLALVLYVNPKVPATTVAEFVAYAKSRPGAWAPACGWLERRRSPGSATCR